MAFKLLTYQSNHPYVIVASSQTKVRAFIEHRVVVSFNFKFRLILETKLISVTSVLGRVCIRMHHIPFLEASQLMTNGSKFLGMAILGWGPIVVLVL